MSTTGLDSSDQTTAEITNIRHLRTAHASPEPVTDEITPPETKARPDDLLPATPPPAEEPPVKETEAPKGSMTRRVLFALLPVMLIAGGYFYVTGGAIMSTDNAYVQADTVGITTDVSGIVREVSVHDNQKVAKNDILFKLDDQQFKLALDRTQAQLDMTSNNLRALQTNYRDLQAQVEQAKKDVDFNTANFNRQQQLLTNSFTPRATFDASRNTLQTSQQKLASLQQQLAGVSANLNDTPDAKVETLPSYKEALAARDEAARQLAHTIVHAPFNGVVTNVPSLQPGQYLTAATTAFNIVSTDHVWVTANPKETELTYVQPGQTVTVDVDTYPGKTWTGTVDSISPASAASFSLLPAENTSGNWVKVVQRIPMRIRIETPADAPPLRIGMSVQVNVETGHSRGLPNFLTSWFHTSTGASNG